jgi:hypothetical protein
MYPSVNEDLRRFLILGRHIWRRMRHSTEITVSGLRVRIDTETEDGVEKMFNQPSAIYQRVSQRTYNPEKSTQSQGIKKLRTKGSPP